MARDVVEVLSVERYSYPDKNTGELKQGTSLTYRYLRPVDGRDMKGTPPFSASLSYMTFEILSEHPIPGPFVMETQKVPGRYGQSQDRVISVSPLTAEERSRYEQETKTQAQPALKAG